MTTYFDVKKYGATGDRQSNATVAIQEAIDAAHRAGGGTVVFPAGHYPSYTLHLRDNITLLLESGATLLADYPSTDGTKGYDHPEEFEPGCPKYQDYGHSYFRNSLIYGENLNQIAIIGVGRIDGLAIAGAHHVQLPGEDPSPFQGKNHGEITDFHDYDLGEIAGQANKAIALKNCKNVTFRDFTLFRGGHFAVLATGVDNLTIDNLKVDTNRDAFDIDCCRNVRISNCSVNSPHDDAIVLKTSYALNELRPCENITITNCVVSGYSIGTMLDGTYDRGFKKATDQDGPTGRIKIGTESNGDFRNIAITNCVFDRCRGLALESVDGAIIEDVVVSNITMRDIVNAPFFIYIGNRARGPEGTPVGKIRRVSISNVNVYEADSRYALQVSGQPEQAVEDVSFENIRIGYRGGLTQKQIREQPVDLVNPFFLREDEPGVTGPRLPYNVPERPKAYPEPSMFGLLPAYGIYARHAKNMTFSNVKLSLIKEDERPAVVLQEVSETEFYRCTLPAGSDSPQLRFFDVEEISISRCSGLPDTDIKIARKAALPE